MIERAKVTRSVLGDLVVSLGGYADVIRLTPGEARQLAAALLEKAGPETVPAGLPNLDMFRALQEPLGLGGTDGS